VCSMHQDCCFSATRIGGGQILNVRDEQHELTRLHQLLVMLLAVYFNSADCIRVSGSGVDPLGLIDLTN
jgi:hypothetical protein